MTGIAAFSTILPASRALALSVTLVVSFVVSPVVSVPDGDILICDFEEQDFTRMRQQGWTWEGDAFRHGPARSTRVMKRRVGEFSGRYLISSLADTDALTGTMTSPEFEIELEYIELLMSGGDHPHRVCVNLLLDDQVVRTVTGEYDDALAPVAFDVKELRGRKARLQIVDNHRGLWGHINVDRIRQTRKTDAPRVISELPEAYGKPRGTVQTLAARRSGALVSVDGCLVVGTESVELDDVLVVTRDDAPEPQDTRGALRLVDGEVWRAEIDGLEKGRISIHGPLPGQRTVPVSRIASLDPGRHAGTARTNNRDVRFKVFYLDHR